MKRFLRRSILRASRGKAPYPSFRLMGSVVLLLALVMISNSLFIIISERQVLSKQLHTHSYSLARSAAIFAIEPLLIRDYPVLETYAHNMVQEGNGVLHVQIRLADGRVITDVTSNAPEDHRHDNHYKAKIRVDADADPIGEVEIGLSNQHVEQLMRDRLWSLGGSFILAALGLGFFIIWLIRITLRLQYREKTLRRNRDKLIRLNSQLKESQAQLIQSEKMASLGTLAAGVAHEINNPIGFVKNNLTSLDEYLQMIRPGLERAQAAGIPFDCDIDFILSDLPPLLQDTLEGSRRVAEITAGLKNFARPEEAGKKHYDLNQCVETTLKLIWNELKYKAEVVKNLNELPPLLGSPQEINQVIMNLLMNAAQAIEKSGRITIETTVEDQSVVLRVSDSGSGIHEKDLPKLFTPFFTTKEVGEGTGLGLSISHGIIMAHDGRIDVESQPGVGSCFSVWLPLPDDQE
jgi:two-component system NtrC family sensor kinase